MAKENGLWHLLFLLILISYLYLSVHIISYYEISDDIITNSEEKGEAIKRIVLINMFVPLVMLSLYLASTAVHPNVPKVWPWINTNDAETSEDSALLESNCIEIKKDGSRRYCR